MDYSPGLQEAGQWVKCKMSVCLFYNIGFLNCNGAMKQCETVVGSGPSPDDRLGHRTEAIRPRIN